MDVMPSIPREYNAAADLLGRNLHAGRAGKVAYIVPELPKTATGKIQRFKLRRAVI